MDDLPERIYAGRVDGFGGWHERPDFVNNVEYIRAETCNARVAAAFDAGAEYGHEQALWSEGMPEHLQVQRPQAERSALDAMISRAREVKPLVWFEVEKSRHGGKYTADAYTIRYIEGLWLLDFAGQSRSDWRFTSLQAAKDHAQFLHTARIHVALRANATDASEGER